MAQYKSMFWRDWPVGKTKISTEFSTKSAHEGSGVIFSGPDSENKDYWFVLSNLGNVQAINAHVRKSYQELARYALPPYLDVAEYDTVDVAEAYAEEHFEENWDAFKKEAYYIDFTYVRDLRRADVKDNTVVEPVLVPCSVYIGTDLMVFTPPHYQGTELLFLYSCFDNMAYQNTGGVVPLRYYHLEKYTKQIMYGGKLRDGSDIEAVAPTPDTEWEQVAFSYEESSCEVPKELDRVAIKFMDAKGTASSAQECTLYLTSKQVDGLNNYFDKEKRRFQNYIHSTQLPLRKSINLSIFTEKYNRMELTVKKFQSISQQEKSKLKHDMINTIAGMGDAVINWAKQYTDKYIGLFTSIQHANPNGVYPISLHLMLEESVAELTTVDYLRDVNVDLRAFSALVPLPGSRRYILDSVAGNYQNAAIYYNKLPANFPAIQELLQVSRIIDNGLKVNWGTAALWLYIKQTCLTNLQNQWVQTHGEIAPEILQNPKQLKDTIQSMDLQLENCTDDCRLAAYLTLHNAPLHSNGGELTFQSAYEFVYHTVKKIDNDIDKLDAVLNEKIEDVPCEIQGTSIDQLNGYEFEKLLGDLFRALGYHSSVTKASGDQGIDIIAEKDDIKIGVQAKCYTGPVGNGAVQEAIAGIRFYNLDKGFVVTNSYFTPSAKELAKSARIVLWDRDILMSKLKEAHLI